MSFEELCWFRCKAYVLASHRCRRMKEVQSRLFLLGRSSGVYLRLCRARSLKLAAAFLFDCDIKLTLVQSLQLVRHACAPAESSATCSNAQ